jgi:threonine synthase
MDLSHIPRDLWKEIRNRPSGMWRWREFLPIENDSSPLSLGEGDTPLIRGERLGKNIGINSLYFKADFLLPTGSLKDRSVALAVTHALAIGATAIATASTGNHAASVAAYAAAAGLDAIVFVPDATDAAKINQALIHGAQVIRVKGTLAQAAKLLKDALPVFGWYPCLASNPYRNEGKKTLAFEVWEQLSQKAPDFMVHPIAGGIGLWAAWKGWTELSELGWCSSVPKMIAAQAANAAPVGMAWEQGADEALHVEAKPTCAESIAVRSVTPGVGARTIHAMRESGGRCVMLSDEKILEARDLLARLSGLFVEPASAAALAAVINLRHCNVIKPDDVVVCVLTGHGLKQAIDVDGLLPALRIDADLEKLKEALSASRARVKLGC